MTFAGVVGEECGGSRGTRTLMEEHKFGTAIIGEPTGLRIALGHRGGAFLYIKVYGKSGHCAQPEKSINAFEKSIDIFNSIQRELIPTLPVDEHLGRSVLTFTNVYVDPGFVSIIPEECILQFDFRYISNFTPEKLLIRIRELIGEMKERDPELSADAGFMVGKSGGRIPEYREEIPPFYTSPDVRETRALYRTIETVTGESPQYIIWPFATDGAFVAEKGSVTLGFGPGDPDLAHSTHEHVRLEHLLEATKIYALTGAGHLD
jgi:acetylornithine deacetylase/succinyl-diaminopimelate desuccinylase-like protein